MKETEKRKTAIHISTIHDTFNTSRRHLPCLVKNSREYLPERATCLGMGQSSSMMWARWSSSREQSSPECGSNRQSPVASSNACRQKLYTRKSVCPSEFTHLIFRKCFTAFLCFIQIFKSHSFPLSKQNSYILKAMTNTGRTSLIHNLFLSLTAACVKVFQITTYTHTCTKCQKTK